MKIAVISDIHGNLNALKAVLEDIKKECVDKVYCCGDLAMAGPLPIETIDLIKRSNLIVIQGNTDEMIVKATGEPNDPYTPGLKMMANSINWIQSILPEDLMTYLKELPVQHEEQIGALKILFVHGSARKNDEGILPNTTKEMLEEIFQDTDADIIFCGHTHYPVIHTFNNKTVINVGSVGRPFGGNPKACYGVLEIPDTQTSNFTFHHRYVEYDYRFTAFQLSQADFDGANDLSKMLLHAAEI